MELYSNAWHILGAALVWLLGAVGAIALAPAFDSTRRRALGLYAWHSLFCIVYLAYVLRDGGDALGYYRSSLDPDLEFELGTAAINVLTSVFSSALGLSLLEAQELITVVMDLAADVLPRTDAHHGQLRVLARRSLGERHRRAALRLDLRLGRADRRRGATSGGLTSRPP